MKDFVHLHLHTQYSVLDGAIKLEGLIEKAKSYDQKAVAITDHGVLHGAVEFYQAAKKGGIKPIVGCEVYITTGSRFARVPKAQGGASTHHLTLLAKNNKGYQNLCKLVSVGFQEGFYFKPRIDSELLAEWSDGLVCLSGCLASEFASYAKQQNIEGARELIRGYQKLFGENYFLEVQPHLIPEQQILNKMARELGTELGVPLIATNDCHYLDAGDHYAQEVLMCISTGKLITDEDRIRHENANLHFKSGDEMLSELPEFEDAISNSLDIAARCNVEFDFSTYHMPQFTPPKEYALEDYFAREAEEGLKQRLEELKVREPGFNEKTEATYWDRCRLEIQLIIQMGFAGYFLVVSDFIRWAKANDIPVGPGRGSAAGSLVAYAMYITEVDPIPHKLLFERFLNPERISLPDIDVDFCIHGRDKVIDYVCNKYGKDKVAQIVTFGTLKAKAAIKDVGRALGLSYAETDRIAKLIPAPRQGFDYPLKEAMQMEKRLREYAEGEGKELMELAMKLEGLTRHTSTHAAGIVIADRPVVELLPLMVDKDENVVTQLSMSYVEKIGLVKFDFLGLKTLTVLHGAVKMIEKGEGVTVDLNALSLNDPRTYKLISSGRTIGVFQLESSGITDMVTRLRPSNFDDLVAILALYRPGPLDAGMVDHYINRKHGREPVKYQHPMLEKILGDTYGIILYQEQIMQVARDMAGYTLGEADMLRRAMGKKKPEEMAKQREKFLSGAKNLAVSDAVAVEVFDQMETFARYGFNRSHSVAYALISYHTAYLKTHYPKYFLASLMTSEMGDTDKTLKNLNECREMGIPVVPPDVNKGQVGFYVVDDKILFGLAAIRGVGERAVEKLIEERSANGPFQSFSDFCHRADSALLNRRMLEQLIKSGAFDWTGDSRAQLEATFEEIVKLVQKRKSPANNNQISLFGDALDAPVDRNGNGKKIPEWPQSIKLSFEKEALGFYLSGHPLERFRNELSRLGSSTIAALKGASDGSQVTTAGVITFLKLKNTKKGDRYATFTLEDLTETLEVLVWPDVYQKVQTILPAEEPVLVTGKLDVNDDRRVLIANKIESAIALRDKTAKEAIVMVKQNKVSAEKLEALKGLFKQHRGICSVKLVFQQPNHSETVITLPKEIAIEPSEQLCNRVEELFGEPVLSFR